MDLTKLGRGRSRVIVRRVLCAVDLLACPSPTTLPAAFLPASCHAPRPSSSTIISPPTVKLDQLSNAANPSPWIAKNCTDPGLGYPFPDLPGLIIDQPDRYRALTVALVLNPLAAGLAATAATIWVFALASNLRVLAVVSHQSPFQSAMSCHDNKVKLTDRSR